MSCKDAHWVGKSNRIMKVRYDLWFQKDECIHITRPVCDDGLEFDGRGNQKTDSIPLNQEQIISLDIL